MNIEPSNVRVEVWNEWDPLRHVIVGRADGACIPPTEPAFMARVPADSDMRGRHGPRTQEAIDRANEQLDGFAGILEKRGIRADRPTPIPFGQQAVQTPDFALGPGSIWTSADGRSWTLAPGAGMPLLPGDQINVVKRTAAGFIAVGANVPGGDQARSTPLVFLSANGTTWERLDAARLHLAAGSGRALDLRYAAVSGKLILIAGEDRKSVG